MFNAIAAGESRIEALAIVTDTTDPTPPCGACRQVLREFGTDMPVLSYTTSGSEQRHALSALLPDSFGPESL